VSAPPLLHVRNLIREFGGLVAVNGVTLDVHQGSTVALIGPNGAGKTTLFNLVAGALSPTSGAILIDGVDVTRWPASRRCGLGIARSFQNVGIIPQETVLTNVLARLHAQSGYSPLDPWCRSGRVRRREDVLRSRALTAIHTMGLDRYADSPVNTLSFGLARRAEVAGMLATEPRLLLLDEPSAGLSGPATEDLFSALRTVQEERGVTVMIIAHDLGFVMGYARDVVVMAEGRVIARGTPAEVRANPAVIEAYLGSAPATAGMAAAS
jgi:branched-chain amino acid transport system ATP-binding protein